MKFIEEKVGKILEMGTGGKLLHRTAMACAVKLRIDKWDLIKCKALVRQKSLSITQKATNRLGKDP